MRLAEVLRGFVGSKNTPANRVLIRAAIRGWARDMDERANRESIQDDLAREVAEIILVDGKPL